MFYMPGTRMLFGDAKSTCDCKHTYSLFSPLSPPSFDLETAEANEGKNSHPTRPRREEEIKWEKRMSNSLPPSPVFAVDLASFFCQSCHVMRFKLG